MDLRLVKTAPGRRLRHPANHRVMANHADPQSLPHKVDIDDPHWHRAWLRKDIVEVTTAPVTEVSKADTATATEPVPEAEPLPAAEEDSGTTHDDNWPSGDEVQS